MSQVTMYPGIRGSPTTTLSAGIDADDLQIVVESTAGIPELPNLLVLGESETDPNAETVVAASRDGTTITLSARGENAVAWGAGTIVWRPFCVEDLAAIQTNIGDHESRIQDLEGTGIATVLSGSGAPSGETGSVGDWYIDTSAHAIYGPKTESGWGDGTSLIGPEGEQGPPGPAGEGGALTTDVHPPMWGAPPVSTESLSASARAKIRYREALARRDRAVEELAAWAIPKRLDLVSGTQNTDWFDATDNPYHEIVSGNSSSQSATLANLIADLPDGAILFFPAGNYRFDTTVDFSKPIVLVGEPGAVIDCSYATANADIFYVNVGGSPASKMTGFEIHGLEFKGPGSNTDTRLIRLFYCSGAKIRYCSIHDFGQSSIRLHECDDTLIEYCHFDNNFDSSTGYSVSIEDRSDRTTIRRNFFTTRGRHFITTATDLQSYGPDDYVGQVIVEENYFHYNVDYRLDTGAAAVDSHDNCHGPYIIRRNVFENVNKMVRLRSCTRGAVIVDNVGINCYLGIYSLNQDVGETIHPKVDLVWDNFIDIDGDFGLVIDMGNADLSRNIVRSAYGYYKADLGEHQADHLVLRETIYGWGGYYADPGKLLVPGSDATETGSVYLTEDEMSEAPDLDPFAPQAWYTGPIFSRASDSSFTVGDTTANAAIFLPGRPIRYRETSGTWRYGIVTAYSSGTVTLAGHPMTTSDDDELQYADMSRVVQMPVIIPGYYEDASDTTLIANDLGSQIVWGQGAAYLVRVRARSRIHDSGTHGTVNVSIAGSNVLSSALSIDADATWYSSTTGVSASYYDVQFDEVIEIAATKAGNGDAQDLTVLLTFVVA